MLPYIYSQLAKRICLAYDMRQRFPFRETRVCIPCRVFLSTRLEHSRRSTLSLVMIAEYISVMVLAFPLPRSLQWKPAFLNPLSNPQYRPARMIPQLRPEQHMLRKHKDLAIPAEAEVRHPALDLDLADQHPAVIPHIDPVAAAGIHVAKDIALDPVGGTCVCVGEDAPVGEVRVVVLPEDAVRVDGRGAARVWGTAVAVDEIRVGDVEGVLARGEADTVGAAEAVGDGADVTGAGVEAVDVLGQLGFGAEALLVAVDGVGEPDGAVGVDDDVVGGVEGPGVVVVEDGGRFVRALGFHVDEAGGFAEGALGAQDQAVAVVGAAVGHVLALRAADFVPREVGGGEEFNLGDDDGLVAGDDGVGGGVGKLVGGDEEGVGGRVEDAGLVEVGGARVMDQELEGGGGAEEGEEGVVVDEEGAGLRGGGGEDVGFPESFGALVYALGFAVLGRPLL
jgi:hypothetical protein